MTTSPDDRAAWAFAKVDRARQHALALGAGIRDWGATANPDVKPSIAKDRLSWEVRLSDFERPPLDEWALILGDAIHNLRSALDVLVWAYVDVDVLTDREATQIAFPVWTEERFWDEGAKRRLKSLPPDVVERIKGLQPFQRPEDERYADALVVLSNLDNQDKHRLALEAKVKLTGVEWEHSVEFADEEAAGRNTPPDVTVYTDALEPSALLTSGKTVDRIVRLGGKFSMQAQIGLETAVGFVGATELVEKLAAYVLFTIGNVSGTTLRAGPYGAT